jgi:hypothetical protein
MSPQRNTARGFQATSGPRSALLAALLAVSIAGAAGAAPLPAAGDVVAAYRTLRDWLDDFDPPAEEADEARVPLADAGGVCVILRRSGRVLGRGVDNAGGELMVRRAAGRAMSEVLGDPTVSALPKTLRGGIGGSLTLELEVAGNPVPVLGRTIAEVGAALEPALDGLAMRRGKAWAMLFPSQLLSTNTAGEAAQLLPGLATELGLQPTSLAELAKLHDVSIYRFRTIHLAQTAPGRAPFEALRGDTIVPESAVGPLTITRLTQEIADYLVRLLAALPGGHPLGAMGDYKPVADQYEPLIAPPLEQALVSLALARSARVSRLSAEKRQEIWTAGHRVFHELRRLAPGEADPLENAVACAMVVHAGHELVTLDPDCQNLLEWASERVITAFAPETGFVDHNDRPISPHGQALVASALARLLREGSTQVTQRGVRQAVDAVWDGVPEHRHVSLLPWLGWAELDYADASGKPVERAETLRRLRDVLERSRYGTPARPGPPDLSGGFALEGAGGRPLADAQSLRPAAWLALMLRDDRLTEPDEVDLALGRHLKSLRFLMQLQVRESALWAYRNPKRARGGIRAAPWDSRNPVAASAMGLLTAAETLISLETLAERGRGTP